MKSIENFTVLNTWALLVDFHNELCFSARHVKELWLCAKGRDRMRSSMPQGIVVMREYRVIKIIKVLNILPSFTQ